MAGASFELSRPRRIVGIAEPRSIPSVMNAKFSRSKKVRHCERSEAISSTAHRPGWRLLRRPYGLLAMTGPYLIHGIFATRYYDRFPA